jgi:hypothetical protein
MEDKQQAQLDAIEAKLNKVAEDVSNITSSQLHEEQNTHSLKRASKGTTAVALGLIGGKVAAVIGFKVSALGAGITKEIRSGMVLKAIKDNNLDAKLLFKNMKENFVIGTIGGIISGATIGAVTAYLGYKRGDRLESSLDLIKHPIDSFERLTLSDEDFNKKFPDYYVDSPTQNGRVADAPQVEKTR